MHYYSSPGNLELLTLQKDSDRPAREEEEDATSLRIAWQYRRYIKGKQSLDAERQEQSRCQGAPQPYTPGHGPEKMITSVSDALQDIFLYRRSYCRSGIMCI